MNVSNKPPATSMLTRKPGIVRRLYDWVIAWGETEYAPYALFALAFAEASFFPVPPDVLLIALAVSVPTKAFRFALICTTGSILGGILGYGIGDFGYEAIGKPIVDFYDGESVMMLIKEQYETYGFWGVLIAAITPIPYKVFTISSGFFKFSFAQFLAASVLGRALRFFVLAVVIWKFGAPIKIFIDKYFNLLAIAFVILLILGFILIKFAV